MVATPERRTGIRIPIRMWVEESTGETWSFPQSGNLSAGGIYLEQPIPHPIGTIVNLQFTLPGDADALQVKAEIVNVDWASDRPGMGLKFVELPEPLSKRIVTFIQTHSH